MLYTIAYLLAKDGYKTLYTLRNLNGKPIFMAYYQTRVVTAFFSTLENAQSFYNEELRGMNNSDNFFILRLE